MMRLIGLSISAGILLAGLSGCGMGPTLTPAEKQKVQSFDVSQIQTLGEAIHKGMNEDELLFYAPVNIAQAKEDYENALKSEDKEEKMASYLAAKKELSNAYETKKLVKKYLSDLAKIDNKMKALDTQEIFASRYDDFKDDYNDLIKTFDEGKVSDALEDKKEVMQEAKDLYSDAVVYRNINKTKAIMQKMSDENLDEAVPKHYEKLEKLYEQTRLKIKREPDNKAMVKKVSKELNNYAEYTETLAKDVVKLKAIDPDDYETYLDKIHHEFASLNTNEKVEAILPLSIEEKINYLKEHKNQLPTKEKSLKTEEVSQSEENNDTVITPTTVPVVEETPTENEQNATMTSGAVQVEETSAAAMAGKAPLEATAQKAQSVEEETIKQEETAKPEEVNTVEETPVPVEESEGVKKTEVTTEEATPEQEATETQIPAENTTSQTEEASPKQ